MKLVQITVTADGRVEMSTYGFPGKSCVEATKFMKELLEDVDVVYLEYDEAQFDQYERTLAYVWIDIDGTYVMVNEIMLATDYAEPVYIKPNLRYADVFRQYEG